MTKTFSGSLHFLSDLQTRVASLEKQVACYRDLTECLLRATARNSPGGEERASALSHLRKELAGAIQTLDKTRTAFRSRQIATVRERLTALLASL